MNIHDFDHIRPFEPEELQEAYSRLEQDPQFRQVIHYLYPQVPFEAVMQRMRGCTTLLDFQKTFCYGFLKDLLSKASLGCTMDCTAIDTTQRYTFVSNHRDIVLDSALLDVLLIDSGFTTTCEIAIGDNLLAAPWIRDMVRINKSFIVERSLGMREMLVASKRLSEYMHFVIGEKHDNVWIAQREGRAKDSNDRTQPSILKMMAMGGTGSVVERLKQLHIVPLAISYEYDPCDYLKAQEFQLRRDDATWKKTKGDDVRSMKTGIMGFKGHIHYHCAPCIDAWLDTLPADMPKGELFDAVASHIDSEIHRNYRIYATNSIALDLLNVAPESEGSLSAKVSYSPEEQSRFEAYLAERVALAGQPGGEGLSSLASPDAGYLRERLLTMYAYPLINKMSYGQ